MFLFIEPNNAKQYFVKEMQRFLEEEKTYENKITGGP
jgi:hypothetical protein